MWLVGWLVGRSSGELSRRGAGGLINYQDGKVGVDTDDKPVRVD